MVRLEDNNTQEISRLSLNDLSTPKTIQGLEQASTPVVIAMAELVTAVTKGSSEITFSLTNIKLHSPSAIVGTPLDSSSRFEYPFPSPQPESEPRSSFFHPSRPPNLPPTVFASLRRPLVHPNLQAVDVPIPPTLEKRGAIELRFPRPLEESNVLGQAHGPIKRRTNAHVRVKES